MGEKKERKRGLLFLLPWLTGVLVFLVYPLMESAYYATQNIRITPLGTAYTPVGGGNFIRIFTEDQQFPEMLIRYAVSIMISVPVVVVFALAIAVMLNQDLKMKGLFRMIFFLPVMIVSGPVLTSLTDEGVGAANMIDAGELKAAIGAVLPPVLAEGAAGVFGNLITILWYAGVPILIFLSALRKIDPVMYEAAKIDGASDWQCFWKITLPNIKNMILLNCVYVIVFMSGNESNGMIGLIRDSMFSGIGEKGYGYASAMAWIYTAVVLVMVGIFAVPFRKKRMRLRKRKKEKKRA